MKFRTEIKAQKSTVRIDYSTPLFFIGSCFSEEVGSYLQRGKFDIIINPLGVMYNPVSVAESLKIIMEGRHFTAEDLFFHNNRYLSFSHDTSFTGTIEGSTLEKINSRLDIAAQKLRKASCLFVTFGTARTYRLKASGEVVSNCHKLPAGDFTRELLEADHIVSAWEGLILKIRSFNKDLKIIFTVSPVRHWKDGAHGNQVSKSILFVAIDKLMSKDQTLGYFPSYELLMDDLRDYRFYSSDLLHPSAEAVKYIWEYFSSAFFESRTLKTYAEIEKLQKAISHRVLGDNTAEIKAFRDTMLKRVKALQAKYPLINFEEELKYFQKF